LVGDTHILFFLFVFLREKSLSFVFKEILITQTLRKPKKSHKQKQECAFFHKNNVVYNLMLFISKLSSVTVGFHVKNGFGVS